MRFKVHPIVGALVFFLVIGLIFAIITYGPKAVSGIRSSVPLLQRQVVVNDDYSLYNPFREKMLPTIERGFGSKLAVNGWVQEVGENYAVVAVPTKANPAGYWVKGYFPEGVQYFGVLKLKDGKFEKTQDWEVAFTIALPELLGPGKQAVLHFDTKEEETNQIISDFQNTREQKQMELPSLYQIAVGVFK